MGNIRTNDLTELNLHCYNKENMKSSYKTDDKYYLNLPGISSSQNKLVLYEIKSDISYEFKLNQIINSNILSGFFY